MCVCDMVVDIAMSLIILLSPVLFPAGLHER